jgi:hypothetical protein
LKDLNKIYVMQIWDEGWVDYKPADRPIFYKQVRDANLCCFSLKKQFPGVRFRYVKREWDGHGKEEPN